VKLSTGVGTEPSRVLVFGGCLRLSLGIERSIPEFDGLLRIVDNAAGRSTPIVKTGQRRYLEDYLQRMGVGCRVARDTASYRNVYRSIPRGTRGKDEDQRLYLKWRVQELLSVQDIHCGCKVSRSRLQEPCAKERTKV
jgi:hypothetical protein